MKRILLKLSGEALAGDKHHGFDEPTVTVVAKQVKMQVYRLVLSSEEETSGEDVPVRRSTAQKLIRSVCLLRL